MKMTIGQLLALAAQRVHQEDESMLNKQALRLLGQLQTRTRGILELEVTLPDPPPKKRAARSRRQSSGRPSSTRKEPRGVGDAASTTTRKEEV
ncbi:MAG: hypothetical protein ACYSYL_00135 [Planctomycetota bacterium]|jgi:hypothetical protein